MSASGELHNPADPVLILLHGATLNGRMWDPVRRYLDPKLEVPKCFAFVKEALA